MSESIYDEVEIEDMEWNAEKQTFFFPCPCGDKFLITVDELLDGEDIARCPSCSLLLRVVYDEVNPESASPCASRAFCCYGSLRKSAAVSCSTHQFVRDVSLGRKCMLRR